jgi:hypothetical protein
MIRTEPISDIDVLLSERQWDFATYNRDGIMRHWNRLLDLNPRLWNGDVLICTGARVAAGRFIANLVKSDYASFVAWRDWGRPDSSAWNCFGVPAAFSNDGALLMGVMGRWTLNAGRVYPPSGTLEPRDVMGDGRVDLAGSMRIELLEETGLDLAQAKAGEMVAIFDGPRIAVAQRHDFDFSFSEIEQIFSRHRAVEDHPELEAIEAVWNISQTDSRMPPYAQEIVRYFHR